MSGGWNMIIMAVLTVLVIVAIIYFTRKSKNKHTEDVALEELKMRYAKGEITEEEYVRRKNIL